MSWTQGLVSQARKSAHSALPSLYSVGGRRIHPKYQRRVRRVRPVHRLRRRR